MKINVCFVADNNYIKPLACTIVSILENAAPETDLRIFILGNDISKENENKILSLKYIKNCEIKFIKPDISVLDNLPDFQSQLSYISKSTYSKFIIADVLKDIDKILYLDCDTIVLSDLTDLFMKELGKRYMAAAEDIGYHFNKFYLNMFKSFDVYVNAGVLLIDLQKFRRDNIPAKLLDTVKKYDKKLIFYDQDAINFVCENKINLIDISYNLQITCFERNNLLHHPKNKQIKKAIKNSKIIHYVGNKKPWNGYVPSRKYYLKYEKRTPFKTDYDFKFKLKIFIQFLRYELFDFWYILRFVLSPFIKGYRHNKSIKIKIFNRFEFYLYKRK